MRKQNYHIFILLILLLACKSDSIKNQLLYKSWIPIFVEEDKFENQTLNRYGISLKLNSDSILELHYYKSNIKKEYPVRFVSSNKFMVDSSGLQEIISLSNDTLILKTTGYKIDSFDYKVTYIPLDKSTLNYPFEKLKEDLIKFKWSYSYKDITKELDFNFENESGLYGDYETSFTCLIHEKKENIYLNTIEDLYWNLNQDNGNYILQLGNNSIQLYPFETFYIKSITNNKIITETWFQGEKTEVIFHKKKSFPKKAYENIIKLITSKKWTVEQTKILEQIETVKDTTPNSLKIFVDLGTLTNYVMDTTRVLNLSDLYSSNIQYIFNPNYSFELIKNNEIIKMGKWQLYPNSNFIKLEGEISHNRTGDEYYSVPDSYLSLEIKDKGVLEIIKKEQLYVNDTTFNWELTHQSWK